MRRTHLVIERNVNLRREFILARPMSTCHVCDLDTAHTYPWTERGLDLHDLLNERWGDADRSLFSPILGR